MEKGSAGSTAGRGVCCSGVPSQGWGLGSALAVMGLWHRHRAAWGNMGVLQNSTLTPAPDAAFDKLLVGHET